MLDQGYFPEDLGSNLTRPLAPVLTLHPFSSKCKAKCLSIKIRPCRSPSQGFTHWAFDDIHVYCCNRSGLCTWVLPTCLTALGLLWFEHEVCISGSCVEHMVSGWWCYFRECWELQEEDLLGECCEGYTRLSLPCSLLPVHHEVSILLHRLLLPCSASPQAQD